MIYFLFILPWIFLCLIVFWLSLEMLRLRRGLKIQAKINEDIAFSLDLLSDRTNNTLKLLPGEHIKVLNIKLGEGVNIYKDDGEPVDSLAILTYSNIKDNNEYKG